MAEEERVVLGMEESYQILRDLHVQFLEEEWSPDFLEVYAQDVRDALDLTDD